MEQLREPFQITAAKRLEPGDRLHSSQESISTPDSQLVKRLSIRSEQPYKQDKQKGNTISECDLTTNWLRQQPDIDVVMVPFGSTRDQHGRRLETRPDPFHQLVAALALPPAGSRLSTRSLNQQPIAWGSAPTDRSGSHSRR